MVTVEFQHEKSNLVKLQEKVFFSSVLANLSKCTMETRFQHLEGLGVDLRIARLRVLRK